MLTKMRRTLLFTWLVVLCVLNCVGAEVAVAQPSCLNATPHAAALLLPPPRPLCTLTLY